MKITHPSPIAIWLTGLSLLITLSLTIYTTRSAHAIDTGECKDISFIFARGSGQTLNDHEYQKWKTAIDDKLQSTSITYNSYELGDEPGGSHEYPAVAVGVSHIFTSLGAELSQGQGFNYGQSVNKGVSELGQYIDGIAINCPNTQIVIGGY